MTTYDVDRSRAAAGSTSPDLRGTIAAALRRWPSAGVAVAVVRRGYPPAISCHGVSDAQTRRPVTPDTVFRIGSLTKTVTAVAVMQLHEHGLIDLDAPANEYLRAFTLVGKSRRFPAPTVRHLLTHTAGVGYWRRTSDLVLHLGEGSGVSARSARPLADLYRGGLVFDVEPGT